MLDFSKEEIKITQECIDNLVLFCDDFDEAIICRNLQGIITSFNKGAERLYGYTKEEVIGKFATNYIPKESEKEFNDISNKIYSGSKKENYETLRIKKNGEFITVSISVYPITHDEKIVGRVAISRAVIDREIYRLAIGCDATKLIRYKESKTGEHIIIIAMTAYAMEGDRKKFIDCGMDDYISKPFNIETLGEILDKY